MRAQRQPRTLAYKITIKGTCRVSKVQIRSARLQAKRPIRCHSETIPSTRHQSRTAGFYALAYDIGADGPEGLAGKTVISYRGTDDVSGLASLFSSLDLRTGWPIGGGVLTDQARLAMDFYFSVKQANPEKTIILTGHSLGGGLARRAA